MAFNVRVVFSGLCAYVPNRELGVLKDPPTKMMVVMVDARQPKTARDEVNLMRPHFPMVFLKGNQIEGVGALPANTDIAWRIDRKQIEIVIPERSPETNRFEVFQAPRQPNPPFLSDFRDFSWGADMRMINPDLADIDPLVFEDLGSRGIISARVLLDKGKLSTVGIAQFNFEFPGSSFQRRQLSNRTALDFREVDEFALRARDLDGGGPIEVSLRPQDREQVEVNIGNYCDGCMPQRVHFEDDLVPDDDFRWFYELSQNRNRLTRGVHLPIPTPKPGKGNGAAKCARSTFNPVDFGG
ncbi:MAG TPA: hypothetical protein VEW48_19090 [Thermoanaerobaculia bacterium]|nr:hypothetical protein [Thermoanaerobaculia bacterium]